MTNVQVIDTAIPDVKVLVPRKFDDGRGFFSETYQRKTFAGAGIDGVFVVECYVSASRRGTLHRL